MSNSSTTSLSSASFKLEGVLGEGHYAVVRLATTGDGKHVAVKQLKGSAWTSPGTMSATVLREYAVCCFLKTKYHPNILSPVEVPSPTVFVFELASGSLRDYVRDVGPAQPCTVLDFVEQVIRGVHFLHQHNILHRDLKPDNIMVFTLPDGRYRLRIADFGLAKRAYNPEGPHTSGVVTLWYRAPELFFCGTHYGYGVDVWSCGCIAAELVMGRPLFNGRNEIDTATIIYHFCGPFPSNWQLQYTLCVPDPPPVLRRGLDVLTTVRQVASCVCTGFDLVLLGTLDSNPATRLSSKKALNSLTEIIYRFKQGMLH